MMKVCSEEITSKHFGQRVLIRVATKYDDFDTGDVIVRESWENWHGAHIVAILPDKKKYIIQFGEDGAIVQLDREQFKLMW